MGRILPDSEPVDFTTCSRLAESFFFPRVRTNRLFIWFHCPVRGRCFIFPLETNTRFRRKTDRESVRFPFGSTDAVSTRPDNNYHYTILSLLFPARCYYRPSFCTFSVLDRVPTPQYTFGTTRSVLRILPLSRAVL